MVFRELPLVVGTTQPHKLQGLFVQICQRNFRHCMGSEFFNIGIEVAAPLPFLMLSYRLPGKVFIMQNCERKQLKRKTIRFSLGQKQSENINDWRKNMVQDLAQAS